MLESHNIFARGDSGRPTAAPTTGHILITEPGHTNNNPNSAGFDKNDPLNRRSRKKSPRFIGLKSLPGLSITVPKFGNLQRNFSSLSAKAAARHIPQIP